MFIYLKATADGKYITVSTDNLEARVERHNKGYVRSTKYRRPLVLHYFEKFEARDEAYRRELYFKSIDGYIWLKNSSII